MVSQLMRTVLLYPVFIFIFQALNNSSINKFQRVSPLVEHHMKPPKMTLVPPGCETGIYYILLAGLAWATDWKILKSFVRKNNGGPPIEVDYIEVYADGIGGWVRVLGIRNFRMALGKVCFSICGQITKITQNF
jgi:hypothetical protein